MAHATERRRRRPCMSTRRAAAAAAAGHKSQTPAADAERVGAELYLRQSLVLLAVRLNLSNSLNSREETSLNS